MPDLSQFTSEGVIALAAVKKHMDAAAEAFGRLNAVENHACHHFHNEAASLNHCVRWGQQAVNELLDELAAANPPLAQGAWEVHPSTRGTCMVIEEDGSEDGRLIADKMRESDARRIVAMHNAALGNQGLLERLQIEVEARRKWQGPQDELAGLLDEARIAIAAGSAP